MKEEENKSMELLINNEKAKTTEILKQIEDITFVNNELTSKLKEAKMKYDELEFVNTFDF